MFFLLQQLQMTLHFSASDDGKSLLIKGLDANYEKLQIQLLSMVVADINTNITFFRINDVILTSGETKGRINYSTKLSTGKTVLWWY